MGAKNKRILTKFLLVSFSILLLIVSLGLNFFLGYSAINVEDFKSQFQVDDISIREGDPNDAGRIFSKGSITGQVGSKTSGGGCGSSEKTEAQSGTIYLVYEGSETKTFNFNYNLSELNRGKFLVNNQSFTSNSGSQEITLDPGDEITIYIESSTTKDTTSKATISQFTQITENDVEVKFLKQEGGIYYLNDNLIEGDYTFSTKGNVQFKIKAEPLENYSFFGRYVNGSLYSLENEITMSAPENYTIYGRFVSDDNAHFLNAGETFPSLNEALDNAQNNSDKTIVLVKSGIIDEGNYSIPNGITLVIPNSSDAKIYDNDSVEMVTRDASTTPSCYSKLEIPSNTSLEFESGSRLYVAGKATTSTPITGNVYGSYGQIELSDQTSQIILENGSTLVCYGYITGNGLVEALDGSTVYEFFQIYGWRGGTYSSAMLNNSQKVFMFNQYYVQNIECRFRIHSGASEIITTGVTVFRVVTKAAQTTFIGNDGIFRISRGYLERVYDYTNDRIIYSINGDATLSSISIDMYVEIDSSKYVLPITNNFIIDVLSGSTITIGQDMALLPGVILNIENGATMYFSDNVSLFVYDNYWWAKRNYASTGAGYDINPIKYCATLNKAPNVRSTVLSEDSPDAEINLNGTMVVNNNASIYTTIQEDNGEILGAANIHSSEGTGVINYVSGLGTQTETYQTVQPSGDFGKAIDSIPIRPALLKNGSSATSEYFDPSLAEEDIVNKSIYFDSESDSWKVDTIKGQEYTITYVDPISSKEVVASYIGGVEFTFPNAGEIGFSFKNFNLKYWKLEKQNLFFKPGDAAILDYGELRVIAVWGGRISQDNNESYYIDYETGEYLTGLKKVESIDGDGVELCLFDNDGKFLSDYVGTYLNKDNRYYYINFGVAIINEGFVEYVSDLTSMYVEYMYVSKDGDLYRNGEYYLTSKDGDVLPSGYYNFDENGYIIREDDDATMYNHTLYVKNNVTYFDGIRVAYGLFDQNNYLYYSDSNGNLVKDKTFYVIDIKDYSSSNIKVGLYYFDSEGRMCDEQLNPIEVSNS